VSREAAGELADGMFELIRSRRLFAKERAAAAGALSMLELSLGIEPWDPVSVGPLEIIFHVQCREILDDVARFRARVHSLVRGSPAGLVPLGIVGAE
jgi:hypothetical protein